MRSKPVPSRVDVWRFSLAADDAFAPGLDLLSPDERARAGRFRFERDRAAYVQVRTALRILLGRRLGQAPESIRFSYGGAGKPAISETQVRFNVSHTEGAAVIALSEAREIGVDVERWRPLDRDVIARVLTDAEADRLRACVDPVAAFFRYWTLKESYLKALGLGLSAEPRNIYIGDQPRQRVGNFCVCELDWESGYSAAVAVECPAGEPLDQISIRITGGCIPASSLQ